MSSRIPLRLRGHPDRLHQRRSPTFIPAGREKIRLEQAISIPVTVWSTRLWNASTFCSFCSFYLPWNYSTAIHLHLMSLINFVPTSKPSTGLSWSSTMTLSHFIRSPQEQRAPHASAQQHTHLWQMQKQPAASEGNPNCFLCFTIASLSRVIERGFGVVANGTQLSSAHFHWGHVGDEERTSELLRGSARLEISSAGYSFFDRKSTLS